MRKLERLLEQSLPEESYYKISPEEYVELMKLSGYHGKGISKLPRFEGKPLWITGNLDLSNTPTDSLGNIGYIQGNLSIGRTKISDLGNTQVKGYVSDYGSPVETKRIAARQRAKSNEMDEYRESDDWNLNNPDIDDLGLKANALFEYLVGDGTLESLSEDEKEKISQNRSEIERLETEKDSLSMDDEDWNEKDDELQEQIDNLQEEIDDLISDKSDVYVLYPAGEHYGLQRFENLLSRDEEYTVGTETEMDDAVLEYAENYIDDVGIEGFNQSFIENYIDEDYLKDYFEDWWRDDIYQNPDVYFNDDDFELTPEQEQRISEIEVEIEDYEREQNELDPDDENYDNYYEDFQNLIDKLESEKEEIVPSTEPTDEMIEEVLEDKLYDVERNPMFYIKEYGLNIKDFVDEDELAKGLADEEGYGLMNSYDGNYDTININGEDYYIMRIN
jgi:hypothetical protein